MTDPDPAPRFRLNADRLRAFAAAFSFVGLAVAGLFFAVSTTPSLLPRPAAVQGVLSGVALAVGYGLGVGLVYGWAFLELKQPGGKARRYAKRTTVAAVAAAVVAGLALVTFWQNSLRSTVGMDAVGASYPLRVGGVALVVGLALVFAGRGLAALRRLASRWLARRLPGRLADGLGFLVLVVAVFMLANDVAFRGLLHASDRTFGRLDQASPDDMAAPDDPGVCGSPESLIAWDAIGRWGKAFVVGGPTREQIADFTGRPALRPIRVSAGLRAGEDETERARVAVDELKRIGGFDREVLVVAAPTGTGWLDPGAVDTLEYLHGGDTAIVSIQYSHLPSWVTVLADPDRSQESAHALFDAVYAHWTTLPPEGRPRLYLHGLSLGALGSETAADLYATFEDPIDGAVFSGTPFPSRQWSELVRSRNPGTPVWLPTYRDGRMVRFMNQWDGPEADQPWGPIRVVYIQHAGDPMVWFSPSLLYRKPAWLSGPRGPDVSPHLRWCPIVTFLQVGFDLATSTSVPVGFGHNYAPAEYVDAWVEVTQPADWTADDSTRLKSLFAEREFVGP